MKQLTQQNIKSFLEKFDSFNDCLFLKVEIIYEMGPPSRSLSVWIYARDYTEKNDDLWVRVHLLIKRVGDYCISDRARETNIVLNNGIHILWSGSLVGLDFGQFVDQPESMEELQKSSVFVIGESLEWQIEQHGKN